MTAVNASLHELAVKLQPWVGYVSSTPDGDGQIIHIKESEDMTVGSVSSYAGLLETDIFGNSIEVLLGPAESNTPTLSTIESGSNEGVTAPFDLLDSSSGQDLTLSPQTFTNSTEAFINDNSNSLGVQMENEAVSTTTEEKKPPPSAVVSGGATATGEAAKLTVKRPRPKAASPNRQGPQQCQVCGKVFGNASALAKHKLTHSDERKYVCNMCGKAFKRQDHLNGHMLTHRNKKPYECKADGCGKSYCDARSLRRHTENHHSTPSSTSSSGSSSSSSSSSTTMSPAQGAASGDAASPHGSSCIQYAPPPPSASSTTTTSASSTTGEATSSANQQSGSGGKSQLQQLLATDPNKNGNLGDNDGFTQLQKVLIDQIMDQQSPPIVKSPSKPPSKSSNKSSSIKMQRAWNTTGTSTKTTTTTTSTPTGAASSPKVSTTTPSSPANPNPKGEMKPVECNLCHRKFKNIPALNGHMRLHGGYFKKDAENKNKCEKKDSNGPPLQTASSNVRALIGEKIINKRITTASTPAPAEDASVPSSTAPPLFPLHGEPSSFVVPAPPQHSTEKVRRHSDAEAFTAPKSSTQQEAEALADLILKPEKVKRTSSDPGRHQQIIRFQTSPADSFTLYQSGDEYGEDVFGQEQMLLQGVDAQQLASIHFQADSLLRDQNEQQLLESYPNLQEVEQSSGYQSGPVNQDLQAVLDSPLPESLAEFSTYHATNMSPNYQTQSPVQYVNSPHTSLAAQSPLQSPLITHDSPGFAYPTPPASHEGQSPCFTQNTILPMVSPKQDYSQMTTMEEPPQASSPLSAAFFTSTMSSSAAVEEALEEVLPGETINNDDIYPLSQSPNPQSPLSIGLTPVPSPLSNMAQSSAPSPHPNGGTFQQNSATSFSQFSLQQQMMPNSDDPLLSSSPKDFQAKRQFEFSGTPLKLVELNTGNFTRILIDSNGEFKILQPVVGKNIYFSGTTLLTTTPIAQQEVKDPKLMKTVQYTFPTIPLPNRPSKISPTNGLDVKLEDSGKGTFLSPTTVPASSPVRQSRKRPRTEPLQLPVRYQSKLRSTRSKPQGSAPYTPQPLLNPQRPGSGLYCTLRKSPSDPDDFPSNPSWSNESIPESDSTPHVNIGPQFQCNVASSVSSRRCRIPPASCHEDLLWDPGIAGCLTEAEVDMYLDFACCAAVPGGGRNAELALHLLNMCGGNIHEAILKLMQPAPSLPKDHPLMNYQYNDNEKWSAQEIDKFHQSLLRHNKDFFVIAQEVGTKSAKQCVQFYYMWKKVCVDDYKRFKDERRLAKKIEEFEPFPNAKLLGIIDNGSPMTIGDHRHFICEYSDCSASFNSKAALNGHIRIHGGTASRGSPTPSTVDRRQPPVTSSTACHSDPADDYPCKICGKVFTKIKSRSAHMKSHRPPDADSSKKKEKDQVSSSTLDVPVQSPYGTTCP